MDKKYVICLFATCVALIIILFAQAYRWGSIEAVTARYYELKTDRDQETKRLNAIIHQANGVVDVQDSNS